MRTRPCTLPDDSLGGSKKEGETILGKTGEGIQQPMEEVSMQTIETVVDEKI